VTELPRKSYVTYGRVTHAQAAEQRRMRDLIERAEKVGAGRQAGRRGTPAACLAGTALLPVDKTPYYCAWVCAVASPLAGVFICALPSST